MALGETAKSKETSDASGFDLDNNPTLREGLYLKQIDEGAAIYMQGITAPVCRVNTAGGAVLQAMNGKNDLAAIAKCIGDQIGANNSDGSDFARDISLFIAELGKAGFLKSRFSVNVVSREVVS